jgi:hypothetical protein
MNESSKAILILLVITLFGGGILTLAYWAVEADTQARREHATKVLTEHYEKVKDEKIKRAVSRGFAHYDQQTAEVVWDNKDVYFVVFGDEDGE